MLRAGVVGLGFMGRTHIEVYQKNPEVEVAAISDAIPERLRGDSTTEGNIATEGVKALDSSKVTRYKNADELIGDEQVDFVDICLPTHLHCEFTVRALNSGKDVFCEKPMAGTLKECNEMIEAAEKSGKKLMIGQCLRFWPEYEILKDYAENGKLGKMLALSCFRGGGTPIWSGGNWMLQNDKSGGALLDMHIHDIDMINYLLGKPESVSALGKNVVGGSGIDIVSTNYYYPEGPIVNAACNWVLNGDFGFRMSYLASFEEGNIIYDSSASPAITVKPHKGNGFTPPLREENGHTTELNHFVHSIIHNTPIERLRPEDARDSVKIALAEISSVKESRPVMVE